MSQDGIELGWPHGKISNVQTQFITVAGRKALVAWTSSQRSACRLLTTGEALVSTNKQSDWLIINSQKNS